MKMPGTRPVERPRLSKRQLTGLRWVWSLGGLTPFQLARRVAREVDRKDVLDRAAQLSYYFVLALFPLLLFLSALTGLLFASDRELYDRLLRYAGSVMPAAAFEVTRAAANELIASADGAKLSLGLLVTIWTASVGMDALIQGLNAAYDVREFRPWWKRRLLAVVMTVALVVMVASAMVLLLWGRYLGAWLAALSGWGDTFESVIWPFVRWVVAIAFVLVSLSLVYLVGPNLREQRWRAILPGSIVALAFWLAASAGFRLYLDSFDSYAKTYGSLGAIIALLVWLYLTGFAVLVGGQVNSEIGKAAAEAGSPEARRSIEGNRE